MRSAAVVAQLRSSHPTHAQACLCVPPFCLNLFLLAYLG
jgi:hypothetical protein